MVIFRGRFENVRFHTKGNLRLHRNALKIKLAWFLAGDISGLKKDNVVIPNSLSTRIVQVGGCCYQVLLITLLYQVKADCLHSFNVLDKSFFLLNFLFIVECWDWRNLLFYNLGAVRLFYFEFRSKISDLKMSGSRVNLALVLPYRYEKLSDVDILARAKRYMDFILVGKFFFIELTWIKLLRSLLHMHKVGKDLQN